jgi:hypothetical protein
MNGLPMSMKLLVADVGKLGEEKGEANIRLVIWLSVIGEWLMSEDMVNLLQGHDVG